MDGILIIHFFANFIPQKVQVNIVCGKAYHSTVKRGLSSLAPILPAYKRKQQACPNYN